MPHGSHWAETKVLTQLRFFLEVFEDNLFPRLCQLLEALTFLGQTLLAPSLEPGALRLSHSLPLS